MLCRIDTFIYEKVHRNVMSEQENPPPARHCLSRLRNFCKKKPLICAIASGFGGVSIGIILFILLNWIFGEKSELLSLFIIFTLLCFVFVVILLRKKEWLAALTMIIILCILVIATVDLYQKPREDMPSTIVVWYYSLENSTFTVTLRSYLDYDGYIKEEYKNDELVDILDVVVEAHSITPITLQGTYTPGDRVTLNVSDGTVIELTG